MIPGSLHAPYPDLQENIRAGGMLHELASATGKRMVFYCAFGERSAMAVQAAQDAGHHHRLPHPRRHRRLAPGQWRPGAIVPGAIAPNDPIYSAFCLTPHWLLWFSLGVLFSSGAWRTRKMPATAILLHLAGYVALLLWGMHMVHSGIVRAFGGNLRQVLAIGLNNRWKAFLAGLGITALLQSSTATALDVAPASSPPASCRWCRRWP